jgi:integrase
MRDMTDVRLRQLLARNEPGMHRAATNLYLRIRESGHSEWVFRYKFGGRDTWMPLGDARDITLKEARAEARSGRVSLDRGKDPLEEKRAAKSAAERAKGAQDSFRQLAEDWYQSEVQGRLKHPQAIRRALDKHILPVLGSHRAIAVLPADCAKVLEPKRKKHPALTNDLLRYLKAVFSFGIRRHRVTGSPVASFTPRLDAGGQERPRTRILSEDELKTLFAAMSSTPTLGADNALIIKLLLATCVRKGELCGAKWEEFDLTDRRDSPGTWLLPASRSKTGVGFEIPLVPTVADWFRDLRVMAGDSKWVLPARRRDPKARSGHMGADTINVALGRIEHGLPSFTIHDLRRTARTHLAVLGISSEVAERCLNHKLKGIEGIYNQHDYVAERRAAQAKWSNKMVSLGA